MYKELCKKNKIKFLDICITVFMCFGLLYAFNWVLYKMLSRTSFADLFTIIFLTFLIYFMIRRYIMTYKYMIIEDELIIQRKIGGKEKVLVDININQIKQIKEEKSNRIKKNILKRNIFWNNCKEKNIFNVIYLENNDEYDFEFQPSDKMMNIINKRMTIKLVNLNKNNEII